MNTTYLLISAKGDKDELRDMLMSHDIIRDIKNIHGQDMIAKAHTNCDVTLRRFIDNTLKNPFVESAKVLYVC